MTKRQCGSCQECCRILPVKEIAKPADARCRHQRHGKGCAIYARRPLSCALWSCGWWQGLPVGRPDHAHYVIDTTPEFITVTDGETGTVSKVNVIQIWADSDYPDAHRDPALRAWLDAEKRIALVRFKNLDGIVLFPPSRITERKWVEKTSNLSLMPEHTMEEKLKAMAEGVQ